MPVIPTGVSKLTAAFDVVILNDSSVAKGGATSLALLSAQMLRARGYKVTFISGDSGDDGTLAASGITAVPMGGALLLDRTKLSAVTRGILNTAIRDRIAQHIAQNDTPNTIYHLHGWSRILSPAVFDALKPVARRSFIHAHDFFLGCPNGAFYDFRKSTACTRHPLSLSCLATNCDRRGYHHKVWRSLRSKAVKTHFDMALPWAGVLALHPKMREPLERSGIRGDLIKTLRNPARPFVSQRIKAEDNRRFCFIGRVEESKGIDLLCKAARLAQVRLRVIGDGAQREALVKAYPEVEFTGWIDHADIPKHLGDVRALVMPSRTPEPFGLVAAEAVFSGLPVVLFDTSLLSEDVRTMGLGFVPDHISAESLADTLTRMDALAPEQLRDISARGFEKPPAFALSPDMWIDGLCAHYTCALSGVTADL